MKSFPSPKEINCSNDDVVFEQLKKKIYTVCKSPDSFYTSPFSFIQSILPDLKQLNAPLFEQLKSHTENTLSISTCETILSELNLFISGDESSPQKISSISASVADIKGVGPKMESALSDFGITTIESLLLHFPYRYEDVSSSSVSGKKLLSGVFIRSDIMRTKYGKQIFRAYFKNDIDLFTGLWFRFSPKYPSSALKKGKQYHLYGEYKETSTGASIIHPEFLNENDLERIRPIYPVSQDIGLKKITSIIENALNVYKRNIPDYIPYRLVRKHQYPSVSEALTIIHSPSSVDIANAVANRIHPAVIRFIYEEFLYIQTGFLIQKKSYTTIKGPIINIDKEQLVAIKKYMPFTLTKAQKSALKDILNDMKSPEQMNRLIQGDVGSGKTIVAFISAIIAVNSGYQVAIIAPTEVLAEQHYDSFVKFAGEDYTVTLLTGSIKVAEKQSVVSDIQSNKVSIIVGTHAILQENVQFDNLGLAIIDEQHRFGVLQRKTLIDKGYAPHTLLMTATPIPRTLAISCYGDLDMSIIDELPPGRVPIITKAAPVSELDKLFPFIQKELESGKNAYFVYPLIEESDKMDILAATDGYNTLQQAFGSSVALLHGKMKGEEKRRIIDKFKSKEIQILISTTVIEVGIDMPDATVMVVMNAERFGLSQLHQLRGRVGRSDKKSYCFLMHSKNLTEDGEKRIAAMCQFSNGFKLSEIDLEIRGPGDFFGTRQSGLPELQFANLLTDTRILQSARQDAVEIVEDDPFLEKSENFVLKHAIQRKWSKSFDMIQIG